MLSLMPIFLVVSGGAWAAPDAVSHDEQVILFPTLGCPVDDGEAWVIDLHGWIFEDVWSDEAMETLEDALDLDDEITDPAERRILRDRLRSFLVDNESGKRLEVFLGGRPVRAGPSEANGHFQYQVRLPAEEVRAMLADSKSPDQVAVRARARDGRVFEGRVHLLAERGLSVISDIDDTLRITEVRDRKAMMRSTFLRPFRPVPGMAEVYAAWVKRYGAEFHYVSASPYQLYEPLRAFFEAERFPEGTMHLKPVRLKDRTLFSLFDPGDEYKRGRIEPLLRRCVGRTFVLVGDSGEKDPEAYASLARDFPRQVRRILIRDVTGEGADSARYQRVFKGLPADLWGVFRDPAEIRDLNLAGEFTSAPATRPR